MIEGTHLDPLWREGGDSAADQQNVAEAVIRCVRNGCNPKRSFAAPASDYSNADFPGLSEVTGDGAELGQADIRRNITDA